MKRLPTVFIKSLFTILIGCGALAADLQAQSDAITVRVPFRFSVGAQNIAPGTYRFSLVSSRMEMSQFLLSILDVNSGDAEVVAVRPEQQRTFEQHGHLIFRNSEGHNVLAEVHFPGTDTFSELIHGVVPEKLRQCGPRKTDQCRWPAAESTVEAEVSAWHVQTRAHSSSTCAQSK